LCSDGGRARAFTLGCGALGTSGARFG
jgi:hypothetical protein